MAGHSKWANIKHRKGAQDAKRGKMFTKIIREITVAARNGGDPSTNPTLRTAINKAKSVNMPSDNIERAIKKGTGNLEGVSYEEVRYEGYGPGGIAFMVDCLTDNKNRTAPEIKTIFNKNGGSPAEPGSVSYLFDRKGLFVINDESASEDNIMELLLDYDIEDIKTEDDTIIITSSPDAYNDISELLQEKGYSLSVNELTFLPMTEVTVEEKAARQCLKLEDMLDDHDDVQNVYSNYDIPDEIMETISAEQ